MKWLHSNVPALQVWAAALKQDSPLLLTQAMAKLPEDDAADMPMLCAALLQRHRHRLSPEAEITVSQTGEGLSKHHSCPAVCLCQVHLVCIEHPVLLVTHAWLADAQQYLALLQGLSMNTSLACSACRQSDRSPSSLGERGSAVAPRSLQRLPARELARLMQAAHHPVITAHRRSSTAVWQVVRSRLADVGSKLAGGPP